MKRDGARTSLWQSGMPDYTATSAGDLKQVFDVLIVGGGVTGIATALQLQKSGKKCIVTEAHNLCFGTTGGTTAHLNTFLDTSYDQIKNNFGEEAARLVAKATTQSLELYRSNIEAYNIDCGYEVKDGFVYSQDEKQTEELEKMYEASREAGVDVKWIDRIPVPVEFEKALVYHEQAQIHSTRYVYGIAKAFEAAGGAILQKCRRFTPGGICVAQIRQRDFMRPRAVSTSRISSPLKSSTLQF